VRRAVRGIRCINVTPFFRFSPCKQLTSLLLLNSTHQRANLSRLDDLTTDGNLQGAATWKNAPSRDPPKP
jgi:hypothetical protein